MDADNRAARAIAGSEPFAKRFRVPLTIIPPVAGVATAIPLWHTHAEPEFFAASAHVIALGGIGLTIQGRFFRLRPQVTGAVAMDVYAIINVVIVLIAIGAGLFFSFRALAHGEARVPDLPLVAGSLSAVVAAFAVLALFGTPGETAEEENDR